MQNSLTRETILWHLEIFFWLFSSSDTGWWYTWEHGLSPPTSAPPPHSVFAGLCSCSRHISRGPAELGHIWQCKSGGQCQGRTVSAREGQWVPAHPSPQHTHKRQTTGERTQVRQAGSSEPWGPGWDLSSTWDRTKFKPSILGYPVQNTLGSSLY